MFQLNDEGSFSITKPYESVQIINVIYGIIGDLKDKIITDATACMGGDTINFSKYFKNVNAVEISEENFNYLKINYKTFRCYNVNLFNQDYMQIYDKLKQDVIYIDPQWGGRDYKKKEHIDLKLGEHSVLDLIKSINESMDKLAEHIFVKAPLNVNSDFLKDAESVYHIPNKSGKISFLLLHFKI
jgi:16S rRNA G966 N2-methylase RsmD